MSDDGERGEDERRELERITLFSDAVIAIAITLLALDIHLPDAPLTDPAALQAALLNLQPKYVAYILSFLVVGSLWIGHNQKFRYLRRSDTTLMWINLLFLLVIGFVPFASSVLGTHVNVVGLVLYDGTIMAAALLSAATWIYAIGGDRLVDASLDAQARRRGISGPLKVAAVFGISVLLGFVAPQYARWAFWLMLPAVLLGRPKRASNSAPASAPTT